LYSNEPYCDFTENIFCKEPSEYKVYIHEVKYPTVQVDLESNNLCRDSSVVQRWATGFTIGVSAPDSGSQLFSSLPCPERLWVPPRLLSNRY